MKFKDTVLLVVMIVVATSAIGGSIYTYTYLQNRQDSANDTIRSAADAVRRTPSKDIDQLTQDLLNARAVYLTESRKLQEMKSLLSQMYTPRAIISDGFIAANAAITTKADTLFNAPASVNPQIKLTAAPEIRSTINAKRLALSKTLSDWKALANSGLTGPSAVVQAEVYSKQVQDYLTDLGQVVSGLTPENSGLTQGEINEIISVIADATQTSQNIPTIATNTGSSGGSGSSNNSTTNNDTPPVTPADVAGQEEIVDDIEETIQDIEDEIAEVTDPDTTGSTGGTGTTTNGSGSVNIPPPPTSSGDDSGKPALVEGINPIPF